MPDVVVLSIRGALAILERASGGTADGVAAFLAREGVTGVPGNADGCALAAWIRKVTGRTVEVRPAATPDQPPILTWEGPGGIPVVVPLPRYAGDFACLFDLGRYVRLIDPAWRPVHAAIIPTEEDPRA